MTTELVTFARGLVDRLRARGVKATTTASAAVPPCLLVPPIPSRDYDLAHGYTATWTVVALANPPGDEKAAEQLDELLEVLWLEVPVESADAASYKLPNASEPVPAYVCKFKTEVETHL